MPERFFQYASQLLDCFRVYLLEQGADAPAKIELRAGEVTAAMSTTTDEACAGLAWVRIVRFFPTDNFPTEKDDWSPVGPAGWAVALEMGVLRCAPVGDAQTLVTGEEWSAAIHLQMRDALAMRKAVDCCFGALVESETLMTAPWEERAPDGMSMGGTQQVTILVDACNDC